MLVQRRDLCRFCDLGMLDGRVRGTERRSRRGDRCGPHLRGAGREMHARVPALGLRATGRNAAAEWLVAACMALRRGGGGGGEFVVGEGPAGLGGREVPGEVDTASNYRRV